MSIPYIAEVAFSTAQYRVVLNCSQEPLLENTQRGRERGVCWRERIDQRSSERSVYSKRGAQKLGGNSLVGGNCQHCPPPSIRQCERTDPQTFFSFFQRLKAVRQPKPERGQQGDERGNWRLKSTSCVVRSRTGEQQKQRQRGRTNKE